MSRIAAITVASLFASATLASGTVHTYNIPDLTQTFINQYGPFSDGTGIWFNPLTGYAEDRGYFFPDPLYTDGQFFLGLDSSSGWGSTPEAFIYTQGFFSRGNGVIYTSTSNLNPARFAAGELIGPTSGYQSPGAGFTDLGPNYGNFITGGHGFIGLTIRNPAGASSSDIFYGYAEVFVDPDNSFTPTLLSFAYNDEVGAPIMTVSTIPEPATLSLVGAAAAVVRRRRR